jgi:hypothetical protein
VADDIFDLDDRVIDEDAGTRLNASRLMKFRLKPSISMNQKAGIAESGMASAEMRVARQSRRNRKTTSTARTAPSTMARIAE